jgi:uncharacterized protein YkwD/stress response protein SCP2
MLELVAGANGPLPHGLVQVRLPGPFDLSALVIGADGRVGGDADFVFYNQPSARGVRLTSARPAGPGRAVLVGADEVTVEPGRLRPGAERVMLVASPADGGSPFGRLPAPTATVYDGAGSAVARLVPPRLGPETALLVGEIYRRAGGWRVRTIGQGYADGLAGLARDFGVDVEEPDPTPPVPAQPAGSRVPPEQRPGGAPEPTGAGQPWAARGPDPSVPGSIPAAVPVPPPLMTPPAPAPEVPADHSPWAGQGRARVFGVYGPSPEPGQWAQPLGRDPLAEVVMLTNQQRQLNGLPPLAPEPLLGRAAAAHSADMAARQFFDHRNPDGLQVADRVTALGYRFATVAENIAAGQRTPTEVVTGWMNSPGHRRNILLPEITQIGVGYSPSADVYGCYWTQVFGTPRTW